MRIIISLHIQPKILRKSHVSTIFLAKNWFFANFHVIFQRIQISEGMLTLWRHVTLYEVQWYLLWYQWIEEVHIYTLVANIGVSGVPYRKSREGLQHPSLEDVLQKKNTSGGRGLKVTSLYNTADCSLFFLRQNASDDWVVPTIRQHYCDIIIQLITRA